ncbi:hypothetical protein BOTBODRAFT_31043 [Botryobasidium botryosum FD-172 SS1]|uniref:AMP-dependent synthetase/ligase domain-containing protein n=1 Tax=Botryobasidium botryosum (strain FD-172 SS1) TaxID=930990 RepID=A0A067MXX1_BOTB1|nr:hypothetical protein BOTBODRAFT_31043 [Botryobasidium botryosum FD-172 SS1]
MAAPALPTPLHRPADPSGTGTHAFMQTVNARHGLRLATYAELWQWSVDHIAEFWDLVWEAAGVVGERGTEKAVDPSASVSSVPAWFPDAKLNWAENMLKHRSLDKTALIQAIEPYPDNPSPPLRQITYPELYTRVSSAVHALRALGVVPGSRVASYSTSSIENVVASLAATALGAIWVSAASDFGPDGVLERFEQVTPTVIFSIDKNIYNAKEHNHIPKLRAVLRGLAARGLSPAKVVVVPLFPSSTSRSEADWDPEWVSWDDFLASGEKDKDKVDGGDRDKIEFYRAGFDHPLWILFSSGTTGKPKPIVHRAGGMLLQSFKELGICADLSERDVYFYYTTTGWMMWNFLVSGLATGCTVVLYDGSPLKDPAFLWNLADRVGMTIFGTSAKYLEQLAKLYKPRLHHSLATLRMILSTGSPLAPAQFDYVYRDVRPGVVLGSITGGTDICSLFAGMNTALPVYRGEIQCRMLGMAVMAFGEPEPSSLPPHSSNRGSAPTGRPVAPGVTGELVCVKPFPVQPLGFWPLAGYGAPEEDVRRARERYRESYYVQFEGVWYHGDHVMITESREGNGGGVVMLGRSDGVLNPGGIRFGSAEIYEVLDLCFSSSTASPNAALPSHTIVDALVVGQSIQGGLDERVILFVRLPDGEVLGEELQSKIRAEIRARRSPRHVPAKIIQISGVPHTLNGKRVEVPVKKIINGAKKESLNAATLQNPEVLAEYERIGAELRADVEAQRKL